MPAVSTCSQTDIQPYRKPRTLNVFCILTSIVAATAPLAVVGIHKRGTNNERRQRQV